MTFRNRLTTLSSSFKFIFYTKKMSKAPEAQTVQVDIGPFLMPIALVLSTIIFSVAFLVGMSNLKIESSTSARNTGTNTADAGDAADAPTAAPAVVTAGTTTIDDDAISGDRDKAKVAIVEFSDFECPFCKRFHDDTYSQIISEFVDSGDVIFVYRDLPLSFHPLAQVQAEGAECIREVAGSDEKYFEAHSLIFDRGGKLDRDALVKVANDMGVDGNKVGSCIDNGDKTDEVNGDAADAAAAGVSGTPGFIIGTLKDDGTVEGEVLSGAQAFSAFETVVNKYL